MCAALSEAALYLGKSADKALDIALSVAYRDVSENIADIAEFYLYVVLVAEKVIDLDTCKTYGQGIDTQL